MTKNNAAWTKAKQLMPGGVSSPVRAFKAVGGDPIFIASGKGSRIKDIDDNEYIDFVGAWGTQILGHAAPEVIEAIRLAAARSTAFGAPTESENVLAEMIIDAVPSIEMVRFVNSGTEATMSALRLARGFTGRSKVMKFAGCYHGHADGLLAKAGSGVATLSLPDSAGVPPTFAAETLVARYNDVEDVDHILDRYGRELAAIIIEPVAGNMGVIPPSEGFLEILRSRCNDVGALLIFDEVMTGFRVARGGAQWRFGILPDLTCLGKIIGGGLPVGAYGGRADIMSNVAPAGPVYQAGTNSGNPIAMAAGIATLSLLTPELYAGLEKRSLRLAVGLTNAVGAHGIIQHVGSMMTLFFLRHDAEDAARATDGVLDSIQCWDDLAVIDTKKFARFHKHCLDNGIYMPPSAYEAFFISGAHSDTDVDRLIEMIYDFRFTIDD